MIPLTTRLECEAGRPASTAVSVTCPIINCAFELAKTSLKGRQSDASSTATGVSRSALKWCVSVRTRPNPGKCFTVAPTLNASKPRTQASTTLADLFTPLLFADLSSAVRASLRSWSYDEFDDGLAKGRQGRLRRRSVDSFFPARLCEATMLEERVS